MALPHPRGFAPAQRGHYLRCPRPAQHAYGDMRLRPCTPCMRLAVQRGHLLRRRALRAGARGALCRLLAGMPLPGLRASHATQPAFHLAPAYERNCPESPSQNLSPFISYPQPHSYQNLHPYVSYPQPFRIKTCPRNSQKLHPKQRQVIDFKGVFSS